MTVLSFFAELLTRRCLITIPGDDLPLLVSVLEQTTVEQPWMPLTTSSSG